MNTTDFIPAAGDTYNTRELVSYKLPQNRPLDCMIAHRCICGKCEVFAETSREVAQVVYWADNSIDLRFTDGTTKNILQPKGDSCY